MTYAKFTTVGLLGAVTLLSACTYRCENPAPVAQAPVVTAPGTVLVTPAPVQTYNTDYSRQRIVR